VTQLLLSLFFMSPQPMLHRSHYVFALPVPSSVGLVPNTFLHFTRTLNGFDEIHEN